MKRKVLIKGHVNHATATRNNPLPFKICKWSVVITWKKEDGTMATHINTFSKKSEALSWIKWA